MAVGFDKGVCLQLRVTATAILFLQQLKTLKPNIRELSVDRLPSALHVIAASKFGVIPIVVLQTHFTSQKFASDLASVIMNIDARSPAFACLKAKIIL